MSMMNLSNDSIKIFIDKNKINKKIKIILVDNKISDGVSFVLTEMNYSYKDTENVHFSYRIISGNIPRKLIKVYGLNYSFNNKFPDVCTEHE